ncbi:MAG: DNA polymerase III subunit [Candidatus Zixiibacteriota bacterium]
MSFDNVVNQSLVKKILKGTLKKDKLAHAYIFYGEPGVGKWALGLELAKAVNCERDSFDPCNSCNSCEKISRFIHPDVKMIFPIPSTNTTEERERFKTEKSEDPYTIVKFNRVANIPVDDIREMQKGLNLKPYEGKKRVVIISDVEKLSYSASNSLLKTLEEPPPNSLLILTTSNLNALLPTVISRCQLLRFQRIPNNQLEAELKKRLQLDSESVSYYVKISRGSLGQAISLAKGETKEIRNLGMEFLHLIRKDEPLDIVEFVESAVKVYGRESMVELFEFIISFLRDVYITIELKERKELINSDFEVQIDNLSKDFKDTDRVEEGIKLSEKIKRDCQSNVNLRLALLSFYIKLRQILKRRVRA